MNFLTNPRREEMIWSWRMEILVSFLSKDFIYLFMRDRKRERQRQRQREKQSPSRKAKVGLNPGPPGSYPGLKVVLNH